MTSPAGLVHKTTWGHQVVWFPNQFWLHGICFRGTAQEEQNLFTGCNAQDSPRLAPPTRHLCKAHRPDNPGVCKRVCVHLHTQTHIYQNLSGEINLSVCTLLLLCAANLKYCHPLLLVAQLPQRYKTLALDILFHVVAQSLQHHSKSEEPQRLIGSLIGLTVLALSAHSELTGRHKHRLKPQTWKKNTLKRMNAS